MKPSGIQVLLFATATVAAVSFSGELHAQPADPAPPVAEGSASAGASVGGSATVGGSASVGGSAAVGGGTSASANAGAQSLLTGPQMQQEVVNAKEAAARDASKVVLLQGSARTEQDVIKLSCVNDKYVQIKGEQNVFDEQSAQLNVVIDTEERFTAFATISATGSRIHKLRVAAEACAGTAELVTDLGNSVTGPTIVDDPTAGIPFSDNGNATVIEPPAYASPYN